jgi:hypothetical protein
MTTLLYSVLSIPCVTSVIKIPLQKALPPFIQKGDKGGFKTEQLMLRSE